MIVTKEQVKYMEDKLAEAISLHPDSITTWLKCYRLTVDIAVTIDNMGVDFTDLGEIASDEYMSNIHWMKDHWPLAQGEPETNSMVVIF